MASFLSVTVKGALDGWSDQRRVTLRTLRTRVSSRGRTSRCSYRDATEQSRHKGSGNRCETGCPRRWDVRAPAHSRSTSFALPLVAAASQGTRCREPRGEPPRRPYASWRNGTGSGAPPWTVTAEPLSSTARPVTRSTPSKTAHYETVSNRVAWCRAVLPGAVLPDKSTCHRLNSAAPCYGVQRRPATGWPPGTSGSQLIRVVGLQQPLLRVVVDSPVVPVIRSGFFACAGMPTGWHTARPAYGRVLVKQSSGLPAGRRTLRTPGRPARRRQPWSGALPAVPAVCPG